MALQYSSLFFRTVLGAEERRWLAQNVCKQISEAFEKS